VREETPTDPVTLGLAALAATLGDPQRARRFLDLTGIGTETLRNDADSPVLLAALIRFLEGHEPDLLSVCEELGLKAAQLTAARRALEQEDAP
jgi:hypothetical protein